MRGGALAGKKSSAFHNFKGIVPKTTELNALISSIDALKRAGSGTLTHSLKQSVSVGCLLRCIDRNNYVLQTGDQQSRDQTLDLIGRMTYFSKKT